MSAADSTSITVIIPAYNEEASIGRTLAAIVRAPESGPDIDVIVAANGCRDRTAEVARGYGVRVIEIARASKTAALNAADEASVGYPRVYLDADMVVSPTLLRTLARAVSEPGVLGAVPKAEIDASTSSWPVRAFYSINRRLPIFHGRLFGRGVIALAREARERFASFPEITADDMFLDAVLAGHEKREIDMTVRVQVPRRVRDLVRRLARVHDGNDEFNAWAREVGGPSGVVRDTVPGPGTSSWLRHVVLKSPSLWPAAPCYAAIALSARRLRRSSGWTVRSGWGERT